MTQTLKDHQQHSVAKERRAREVAARVRQKGAGKALHEKHFYPELVKLRELGWTKRELVHYFAPFGGPKTERRYNQILAAGLERSQPKDAFTRLPLDLLAMLEWTPKAFERFFLAFSGYDYLPAHVRSWLAAFMTHRRLLLNVPPGHAKSEFFMIWVPAWLICRDRNVQILMVSNSHEDASHWALEVAGQLEHNEGLKTAFGRFAPETQGDQTWTPAHGTFSVAGRTRRMKGAQFTVESRGMTSRVLGRRADFIIVDDPTKQEDAASDVTRKAQLAHLRQQVFTRAEPQGGGEGGRIAVIGQRVHLLDLYGELERQEWERGTKTGTKAWHVEKYPAVLDWDGRKVLWPQRWPWREIEQAYADVGGHAAFSCMYQQEPMPEGSGLVTQAWIEGCKDHKRGARQGFRPPDGGVVPIVKVVSVDPTPTQFHGIIVGDLLPNRQQFAFAVTEVIRLPAGVHRLKAEVDRIVNSQRPDYLIFEESGFLSFFKEDPWFLELQGRVNYVRHHTGVNKNSAEYGVQSLAGDFELRHLSLPYGDEEARKMTDMLALEALQYPDGKLTDLLMALWFVKVHYKELYPRSALVSRVTARPGQPNGGWSFLRQLKDRGNEQDRNYRRWQQAKRKEGMRVA